MNLFLRKKTVLMAYCIYIVNIVGHAVLHTTALMHCKARQGLRNLFNTNQGNGSGMIFVTGSTKYMSKIWRSSYDLMTWCRKQTEGINYIGMEDLNLCSIKIIFVNLSNKRTQDRLDNFFLLHVMNSNFIPMCSYLYSVCLVSWVLKSIYCNKHLLVVASKYSLSDMENST